MPSSVIQSYSYDKDSKELKITFVSGLIYAYKNVPEEEFLRMKTWTSKGAYLNKVIKGKYEFVRLEE